MISSSGTNRSPSGSSTNRGTFGGTFTRANLRTPVIGSRTTAATFSDRLEMYGNGCAGSTDSGVSTGKIRSRNRRPRNARSSSPSSCQRASRMRFLVQRGQESSVNNTPGPRLQLVDAFADRLELLGRGHPVGRDRGDPGFHLFLEPGHPNLEELIQVLAVDREELDAFRGAAGWRPRPGPAPAH